MVFQDHLDIESLAPLAPSGFKRNKNKPVIKEQQNMMGRKRSRQKPDSKPKRLVIRPQAKANARPADASQHNQGFSHVYSDWLRI